MPTERAAPQGGPYLIRGRVVNVVTGVPVGRADVFILGHGRPAVTDAEGHFRHERLLPIPYLLRVEKEGYVTMTWEVTAHEDTSLVNDFPLRPQRVGALSGEEGTQVITGRVIDQDTRAPVRGAMINLMGRFRPVLSDSAGRFRHTGLAAASHVIQVTKAGYETISVEVMAGADSSFEAVFELPRSNVFVLDSMVVTAVADEPRSYWHPEFEIRRREGRGQFVTRPEIERRRAASVGDLLRTLNGLRMNCTRTVCEVRMTRTNCRPAYFADGYPADAGTVERMPVDDLFGVEVYDQFEVPVQLQRPELRCGVIAVWTRRGPPPR